MSAQDLLAGLEKLEYSLSSAKLDSWKGMFNEFLKFQKASEGKSSEDIEKLFDEIRESQQNLELSKKCFGTDLYDIKKVTEWDDRLVNSLSWDIGECREFIDGGIFSGWIIRDLPVQKKPFIKINGVSYGLLVLFCCKQHGIQTFGCQLYAFIQKKQILTRCFSCGFVAEFGK